MRRFSGSKRKITFIMLFVGMALSFSFNAAESEEKIITWSKSFDPDDIGKIFAIHQTAEGHYILLAHSGQVPRPIARTFLQDRSMILKGKLFNAIIKLDENGQVLEKKVYNDESQLFKDIDFGAENVIKTRDGGRLSAYLFNPNVSDTVKQLPWIFVGENTSYEIHLQLIKQDQKGKEEWRKDYGRILGGIPIMIQEHNEGFYLAGNRYFNPWIMKIDNNGNKLFEYEYSKSKDDIGKLNDAKDTRDGGIIAVGTWSKSRGTPGHFMIFKLDGNGKLLWDKLIGSEEDNWALSMDETKDGKYIVAGVSGEDVYVIKIDGSGSLVWENYLLGFATHHNLGEMPPAIYIHTLKDGNYIINGRGCCGNEGWALMKLDGSGNLIWEKYYKQIEDTGYAPALETNDGGFLFWGHNYKYLRNKWISNSIILKLDGEGNLEKKRP